MSKRTMGLSLVMVANVMFASGAIAAQYVYPAKGQSPEQQKKDESACHTWAVEQSKYDPAKPPPAAARSRHEHHRHRVDQGCRCERRGARSGGRRDRRRRCGRRGSRRRHRCAKPEPSPEFTAAAASGSAAAASAELGAGGLWRGAPGLPRREGIHGQIAAARKRVHDADSSLDPPRLSRGGGVSRLGAVAAVRDDQGHAGGSVRRRRPAPLPRSDQQGARRAAVDEVVRWENPKTESHGELKVLSTFEWKKAPCRKLRVSNEARGRKATNEFNFCRIGEKWKMVSPSELKKQLSHGAGVDARAILPSARTRRSGRTPGP